MQTRRSKKGIIEVWINFAFLVGILIVDNKRSKSVAQRQKKNFGLSVIGVSNPNTKYLKDMKIKMNLPFLGDF